VELLLYKKSLSLHYKFSLAQILFWNSWLFLIWRSCHLEQPYIIFFPVKWRLSWVGQELLTGRWFFPDFSRWRKPEYPERTTDHGQATGKLYHLRLRVECTLFVIYKAWREPTVQPLFFGGVRVAHLFSFLCCSIMCLYVLSSLLCCPLRCSHKNDVRYL
jgi:hypothetical protein